MAPRTSARFRARTARTPRGVAHGARAALGAGLVIALTLSPRVGAASGFWEEVREPGMPAYREALARAELAFRARRYREVEAAALEAIAKREDRAEGHLLLALSMAALGQTTEALPHLLRGRALDPSALDDAVLGVEAARLAVRAGEWALAADVLGRLIASMPEGPTRRFLYSDEGDVLLALGPPRLEDAVRAYEAALRDGRGHEPRAALGLALALHRAGRVEEAAGPVAQAVDSGRLESVLAAVAAPAAEREARRALVHEAMGRLDEARAAWAEVASRPEWAEHARAQVERLERAQRARDAGTPPTRGAAPRRADAARSAPRGASAGPRRADAARSAPRGASAGPRRADAARSVP